MQHPKERAPDLEGQLIIASMLAHCYVDTVKGQIGMIPGRDSGHLPKSHPAYRYALAYAASDAMAPTRRFHNDCSAEDAVLMFPYACVFGALRQVFIPLEPLLREAGAWTKGVPFSRLHKGGGLVDAVVDAVERSGLHTGTEIAEQIGKLRDELVDFQDALDVLGRAVQRGTVAAPHRQALIVPAGHWTQTECEILAALWHRCATLDQLAGLRTADGERAAIHRSYSAIREALRPKNRLRQSGLVENDARGYYRTDALPTTPPPDLPVIER